MQSPIFRAYMNIIRSNCSHLVKFIAKNMKTDTPQNSPYISKYIMKDALSRNWVTSHEQQIMEFRKDRFNLQPEVSIKNPAINSMDHFKVLFDFGYYLCMTPFKFVFSKDVQCSDICVSLKTSCLQTSLTKILLWLSIIGHSWNSLIKIYSQSADIIIYFNAAHFLIHLIMMITFYYSFFSNSENCFKIMSQLAQSSLLRTEQGDDSTHKVKNVTHIDWNYFYWD